MQERYHSATISYETRGYYEGSEASLSFSVVITTKYCFGDVLSSSFLNAFYKIRALDFDAHVDAVAPSRYSHCAARNF